MGMRMKNMAIAAAVFGGLLASPVFSASCGNFLNASEPGFEKMVALAKQGNRDSQCTLGSFYKISHDTHNAIFWHRKAAEQGQAESQYRLFYLLVESAPEEALDWLHKAAEQGYAVSKTTSDSRYDLGQVYETGDIRGLIPIDRSKAAFWYRKAAEAGYPRAQATLERLQAGLLKGWPEKVAPVQNKAEQGDPDSQYQMGLLYALDQPSRDYQAARSWFHKAAEQGHAAASVALGVLYEEGLGGKKEHDQASLWFSKAAEQAIAQQKKIPFSMEYDPWLLLEGAQSGIALGQWTFGFRYAHGYELKKNPVLAGFFYELLARQGSEAARTTRDKLVATLTEREKRKVISLADSWQPGMALPGATGAWKDNDEIADRLKKAEEGDAETQYQVAWGYETGYGNLPVDKMQAVLWYKKAAERGHIEAQKKLAWFYNTGEGVAKNVDEAMKWYRLAADQGDAVALGSMASLYIYEEGKTFQRDSKKAAELYLEAAKKGHAPSQYQLGVMYEFGKGVAADLSQALFWYEKAAAQKHHDAKRDLKKLRKDIDLAKQQKTPSEALPDTSAEIAFLARQKAAEDGDVEAQYMLGMSYQHGRKMGYGVEEDPRQAVLWYEKAALQGDLRSQQTLAQIYFIGLGVEKNTEEGVKWSRKAAEQGDVFAQNLLGTYLFNTAKTSDDVQEAQGWFLKAAEQGHNQAQYNLGGLYLGALGIPRDLEKSRYWLEKASQGGNVDAQASLELLKQLQERKAFPEK